MFSPINSKKTKGIIVKDWRVQNNAILFIPCFDIVGSTKNQWPIIIEEKTPLINETGNKLLNIRLNKLKSDSKKI